MIVGSYTKRVVGSIFQASIRDENLILHNQPVLILREVSIQEWLKQQEESNGVKLTESMIKAASHPDHYFYAISID